MVKPDLSPLIDALFNCKTAENECSYIKNIIDAFEDESDWPRHLFNSGEAARKLNPVAFAALCEVLEAQDELVECQKRLDLKHAEEKEILERYERVMAAERERKGKGNVWSTGVDGKGKGKLVDLGFVDERIEEEKGVAEREDEEIVEDEGAVMARGRTGKKRSKKNGRNKPKFNDLPHRQIVCALPMPSPGCSSGPPKQLRWKPVEMIDGKVVRRRQPVRVGLGEGSSKEGETGGKDDPITLSSASSSSSSDDDTESPVSCDSSSSSGDDDSAASGDADEDDDWPDVVNGIDISHWNPWVRVFMEAVGGVPFQP